jgi:hypothetical protein
VDAGVCRLRDLGTRSEALALTAETFALSLLERSIKKAPQPVDISLR